MSNAVRKRQAKRAMGEMRWARESLETEPLVHAAQDGKRAAVHETTFDLLEGMAGLAACTRTHGAALQVVGGATL